MPAAPGAPGTGVLDDPWPGGRRRRQARARAARPLPAGRETVPGEPLSRSSDGENPEGTAGPRAGRWREAGALRVASEEWPSGSPAAPSAAPGPHLSPAGGVRFSAPGPAPRALETPGTPALEVARRARGLTARNFLGAQCRRLVRLHSRFSTSAGSSFRAVPWPPDRLGSVRRGERWEQKGPPSSAAGRSRRGHRGDQGDGDRARSQGTPSASVQRASRHLLRAPRPGSKLGKKVRDSTGLAAAEAAASQMPGGGKDAPAAVRGGKPTCSGDSSS